MRATQFWLLGGYKVPTYTNVKQLVSSQCNNKIVHTYKWEINPKRNETLLIPTRKPNLTPQPLHGDPASASFDWLIKLEKQEEADNGHKMGSKSSTHKTEEIVVNAAGVGSNKAQESTSQDQISRQEWLIILLVAMVGIAGIYFFAKKLITKVRLVMREEIDLNELRRSRESLQQVQPLNAGVQQRQDIV